MATASSTWTDAETRPRGGFVGAPLTPTAAATAGSLATQLHELEKQLREREQRGPVRLRDWVDLAEAWQITRVLDACSGNRTAAARELGIGRRTLYAKMEKLGIAPRWTIEGGD